MSFAVARKYFVRTIVILFIIIITAYFVLTSGWFVRKVVIPVAEQYTGLIIAADEINVSPITGNFELGNLRVSYGDEVALKSGKTALKVNLFSLLSGKIAVDKVFLQDTDINIKEKAPESIDDIHIDIDADKISEFNRELPKLNLAVNSIRIKNLNLAYILVNKAGQEAASVSVRDFNVSGDGIKTGKTGTVEYSGMVDFSNGYRKEKIMGELTGRIGVNLSEDLIPEQLKLSGNFNVDKYRAKIAGEFKTDKSEPGKPRGFAIALDVNDLYLLPFTKVFINNKSTYLNGELSKLNIDLSGKDLFQIDFDNNIHALVQAVLENVKCRYSEADFNCYSGVKLIKSRLNVSALVNGFYKVDYLNIVRPAVNLSLVDKTGEAKSFVMSKSNNSENKTAVEKAAVVPRIEIPFLKKPIKFDLNKMTVENGHLNVNIKRAKSADSSLSKIYNFNLNLPDLKSDQNSNLNYSGELAVTNRENKKEVKGKFKGEAQIRVNGRAIPELLKVKNITAFQGHSSPIDILFSSQAGSNGTQPYDMNITMTNFRLLPVFKTFLSGDYIKSKGAIESMKFNLKGNDLVNIDLSNGVAADVNCQFENIELPVKLLKYAVFKILFLPVEIVANINSFTKTNVVPQQLNDAFNAANKLGKSVQNMHFSSGVYDADFNNGVMDIKECLFKGGMINAVRRIELNGTVNLEKDIDLKTKTSLVGVVFPVGLEGNLDNPKVKILMVVPGMVVDTAGNLVMTGVDLGLGVGSVGVNVGSKALQTGYDATKGVVNAGAYIGKGLIGMVSSKSEADTDL